MSETSKSSSLMSRLASAVLLKKPATTTREEIESVHRQLLEWRSENPSTLVPHLRSVLDSHIAKSISGCSEITAKRHQAHADAFPTDMTLRQLVTALNPESPNQPVPETRDIRSGWKHYQSREEQFSDAVSGYCASLSVGTLGSAYGLVGLDPAVSKNFDKVTDPEWLDAWLTRLHTLTLSVLNGREAGIAGDSTPK